MTLDVIDTDEDPLDLAEQGQCLRRRYQAIAVAQEKLEAAITSEIADELADGRLGNLKGLGRGGDAAQVNNRPKSLELAYMHAGNITLGYVWHKNAHLTVMSELSCNEPVQIGLAS